MPPYSILDGKMIATSVILLLPGNSKAAAMAKVKVLPENGGVQLYLAT